jgi:glycosyltransferase involved in cell wall biosynthesis
MALRASRSPHKDGPVRQPPATGRRLDSTHGFTSAEINEFVGHRAAPARARSAPAFSIVMPSYNQGALIERSLLSVLNQDYPNLELIVMDGGSKDGTRAVLERYDADITRWVSEPDGGQSAALNKGFRHATGAYVGWLNSDDIYLPGALSFAAEVFERSPEVQVVYGDWYTLDLDNRIRARYFSLPFSRAQLITEGFFCNAQAMFWRRGLHRRFGEFDARLHYTMDYDLMLRLTGLVAPTAFYRSHRPLGCFRVYPGQKTGVADDKVAAEHALIASKERVDWKFGLRGRALRRWYRAKRVCDYLRRGGPGYVMWKAGLGRNPVGNT